MEFCVYENHRYGKFVRVTHDMITYELSLSQQVEEWALTAAEPETTVKDGVSVKPPDSFNETCLWRQNQLIQTRHDVFLTKTKSNLT